MKGVSMSDTENRQDMVEGQQTEVMPTSEQPTEARPDEPTLPDEVKERTAQEFEKLKAANKALAEKLAMYEGNKPSPTSVLDELRPNLETVSAVTVPQQGTDQNAQLFDDSGYVDPDLLNKTIAKANEEARRAQEEARKAREEIQRFQESQIVREVHKDFPMLDPNNVDSFDPTFYDFVKNELVGQMMKNGKEDLRAAAAKAASVLGVKQVLKPSEEKAKETVAQRDQVSAPTSAQRGTAQPINQDALVAGTQKGDPDAIFKRLQASGY